MFATVGGLAQTGNEKARMAVFDGIELPNFADVSAGMRNNLMFSNGGLSIYAKPIKLQFCTTPDIRSYGEQKKQSAPTYTQFALNVPTISETVRERRMAAESQQNDLESTFVDDGKEHIRDGEKIKNASLLILEGLLYFTLGVLIGDNDDNGVYDLFEQENSISNATKLH